MISPEAYFSFSPVDPIKALFWSAVINGVVAVPAMAMMMLITADKKIMGKFAVAGRLRAIGRLSTAAMVSAAVVMGSTPLLWTDA